MTKPLLLDLFCGEGGASKGYVDAGFDVIGVDIEPQPRYPFEFMQDDALNVLQMIVNGYLPAGDDGIQMPIAAIHASPPCQGYTTMSNRKRGDWPMLIEPVRNFLEESGKPWVLENVPGARKDMPEAFILHGGMFDLGVSRPRLFETSFPVSITKSPQVKEPIGVYGALDGRRLWTRKDGTVLRAARTLEEAQQAMGIHWMQWDGLKEAIPPAYTEHIGKQLLEGARR